MFYFLYKANKKVSSVTMMEASCCCHANKEQVLSSVLSFLSSYPLAPSHLMVTDSAALKCYTRQKEEQRPRKKTMAKEAIIFTFL